MDATGPTAPAGPGHASTREAMRAEVGRLRRREVRRLFPLSVHIGVPEVDQVGFEAEWPLPPSYDAGLLLDVVDALVDRWLSQRAVATAGGPPVSGWLVRPGRPSLHDVDLRVSAAASRATAAHGLILGGFWAVTRYGWLDVATGEHREWKRLRL